MDLKHGERIILRNEFIARFANKADLNSKTFIVVAVTDVAVAVQNLRSGRMYTLSIPDVIKNLEAPPNYPSSNEKRPTVILNLPPVRRPLSGLRAPTADFIAPITPVKFEFAQVSAKTAAIEAGDLLSYLYNE
jgi:hypothetical protein